MALANQRSFPGRLPLVVAFLTAFSFSGHAATINWTNTSGGDWTNAANWDPNQVPLPTDNAVLNLDMAGPLTVPASNTLNWVGGTVGGPLNVCTNAVLTWSGNGVADLSGGSLTVAQGGTLEITDEDAYVSLGYNFGNYQAETNGGFLTNFGTVIVANRDGGIYGCGGSAIYNAGFWLATNQIFVDNFYGSNTFINAGTLQGTSDGAGVVVLWNFLSEGGTLGPSGAEFGFTHWMANGVVSGNATIVGYLGGTIASGSEFNLDGFIAAPLTISSNAVLNWYGGINVPNLSGGSLTVAPGGTLTIGEGVTFGYNGYQFQTITNGGFLTNYGTVVQYGDPNGESGILGYGGSVIYNAGLWQEGSLGVAVINQYGSNTFINAGAMEGPYNGGDASIGWSFMSEGGTLGPSGEYYFFQDWKGNGLVGGTAAIVGNITATIAPGADLTLAYDANGNDSGSIIVSSNAVLTWTSPYGVDVSGGSFTIAQGGTLVINGYASFGFNRGNYQTEPFPAFLTNYGTVILNGSLSAYGGSVIYNAGLWTGDDDSFGYIENGYGTNTFVNSGTFQAYGVRGSGISTFVDWNFENNGGVVKAGIGPINFSGAYSETSSASLSLTLASPNYDEAYIGRIHFANPPHFHGSLGVILEPNWPLAPGTVLQALTYPSATGGFRRMNLDLGGGLILQPQYKQTEFDLTVTTYEVGASRPQLLSTVVPNGLFLQWPDNYTGWTLQSTTNLAGPGWSPVSLSCSNNIVVPETGPQQFFRLQNGD